VPRVDDRCYACDAKASGWALSNRKLVRACKRHKWVFYCSYCDEPVNIGRVAVSIPDDADFDRPEVYHAACWKEANR
jgi:hypothetical protein